MNCFEIPKSHRDLILSAHKMRLERDRKDDFRWFGEVAISITAESHNGSMFKLSHGSEGYEGIVKYDKIHLRLLGHAVSPQRKFRLSAIYYPWYQRDGCPPKDDISYCLFNEDLPFLGGTGRQHDLASAYLAIEIANEYLHL